MECLKLSITSSKDIENPKISANYDVKLGDTTLGRGVLGINLSMPAGEKPKLSVEYALDSISIDGVDVVSEFIKNEQ